jgi:hypothetical protein
MEEGVERLTKKELRALLEFIKECYPICDLETFAQGVVSRLSKIVHTEFISYNGVNPSRRRNICSDLPIGWLRRYWTFHHRLLCLAFVRFLLDMHFNFCQKLTAYDKTC